MAMLDIYFQAQALLELLVKIINSASQRHKNANDSENNKIS